MSFCTRCGRRADGSARFCTGCGMPLPTRTSEQPTVDPVAEPAGAPTRGTTAGRLPRSRRRPGGWVALAVALVLSMALGGAAAWRLTAHNTPSPVTAAGRSRHTSAATATTATAGTLANPASSAAATATTAPATTAPTPSTSGSVTVAIGAAAAQQANAPQVAAFLAGYFEAINDRDYQAYEAAFDDQARPDFTSQQFLANFGTTTDSDATLVNLSPASTGAWAATVTFVSHQSPALSTTNSSCTDWYLTLSLEASGNSYVIGRAPPSYPQTSQAC